MAPALCESLQFCLPFLRNLKDLNLSRNRFGDRLVSELVQVLHKAPNITSLDLTNVAFTGFGLCQFAEEYLATDPKCLESLDLTSNKMSDLEQAYRFG